MKRADMASHAGWLRAEFERIASQNEREFRLKSWALFRGMAVHNGKPFHPTPGTAKYTAMTARKARLRTMLSGGR